ncbi:uncharacterized protein METZ01_LOCUS211700, partial [marine metagenome]
ERGADIDSRPAVRTRSPIGPRPRLQGAAQGGHRQGPGQHPLPDGTGCGSDDRRCPVGQLAASMGILRRRDGDHGAVEQIRRGVAGRRRRL